MNPKALKFGRFCEHKSPSLKPTKAKSMRVSIDEDALRLGDQHIPLTFIYHIDLQINYLQISYWDDRGMPIVRALTTPLWFGLSIGRARRLLELENCLKTSIHAAKATMLLKGRMPVAKTPVGEAFGIA